MTGNSLHTHKNMAIARIASAFMILAAWSGASDGAASGTPASASAPVPAISRGFFITQEQFEKMFPERLPFYTYAGVVSALSAYPAFGNSGNDAIDKQEIAAFLAHVSHETYSLKYIDEIDRSNAAYPGYCRPDAEYPCATGQQYYGRGPLQISWNDNYGAAGVALHADLLNHPNLVSTDATIAWDTAIWFWMTSVGSHGYTMHTAMTQSAGFGETISIINGRIECNASGAAYRDMRDRVNFYRHFTQLLGVQEGNNLSC
jgi:hypothetical protein